MRTNATSTYQLISILLAASAAFAAACGSSSNPTSPTTTITPKVASVTVASVSRTSSSIQLKATARMSDGTDRDVTGTATWQSSNASLATVSASGLVSVFGSGELDIRATYQAVTGALHLLVTNTPVVSMTISGAPATPATSFQLTAVARMADGSTQDVTRSANWESSNPDVATVLGGLVTVVADGEVDIRANYQSTTATAHVAVTKPTGHTLTGFVTDVATNKPLAGVRVQIVGGGSTRTDDNGSFGLAVNTGRVLVEFSRDGYQTIEKDVTVTGDAQLQVAMTAAGGPGE